MCQRDAHQFQDSGFVIPDYFKNSGLLFVIRIISQISHTQTVLYLKFGEKKDER